MRLTLFTVLLPSFLEVDLCELGEYTEGVAKRIARDRRQEQAAGGSKTKMFWVSCLLLLPPAPVSSTVLV
jgi:hypothetical protein